MSDLDQLRSLGEQIVPPPLDSLRETARRRSRMTGAAVGVTAVAVTAAVLTTTLGVLSLDDDATGPEPVAPSTETTDLAPGVARPLTYAEGSTLHLGANLVSMAADVAEIDLTDGGAVVRTDDGRIWFTDGGQPTQVGDLGTPGRRYATGEPPLFTPNGWVVSGNTGGLAAWFEFPSPGEPVLVVHDTAAGSPLVDRVPLTVRGETWEMPQSVTEDAVFWFVDPQAVDDAMPAAMFDLSTGTQTAISGEEYAATLPGEGTARLLFTTGPGPVPYSPSEGISQQFGVDGDSFRPVAGGDFQASDGLTGVPISFTALDGYRRSLIFLTQWVDDDTVVLRADAPDGYDLLACEIATRTCELEESLPTSVVLPDLG